MQTLLWAAGGTGFPFLMTALGAAVVFFFKERISSNIQRIFLGFAAGVMIAASVWSLLIPAIRKQSPQGRSAGFRRPADFFWASAFWCC